MGTVVTTSDKQQSVRGVCVSQAELIRRRFDARQLRGIRKPRRLAQQQGQHASPFKGRGLSFHHAREYQGGDEIRHIDWRVTARTNKAHTKVFEEERERPLVICLDQRQTMFFGSRNCFKSVLACHAAAILAWTALDSGDRIGGLVFNDTSHSQVRPRRSQRAVLHLLHCASAANQALTARPDNTAPHTGLAESFEELRRITRPGAGVFIISDFHGYNSAAERQLHLLARHADVVAICIRDPIEAELPPAGIYPFSDGRQKQQLRLSDALRQRYQSFYQNQQKHLHDSLRRAGVQQIEISTDDALVPRLQQGLQLS